MTPIDASAVAELVKRLRERAIITGVRLHDEAATLIEQQSARLQELEKMAPTISELVDTLWVVHGKEPKGCQAVADELCTRFPNKSRFQIHARCFKHDMHDTLVPYLKEKT